MAPKVHDGARIGTSAAAILSSSSSRLANSSTGQGYASVLDRVLGDLGAGNRPSPCEHVESHVEHAADSEVVNVNW